MLLSDGLILKERITFAKYGKRGHQGYRIFEEENVEDSQCQDSNFCLCSPIGDVQTGRQTFFR